MKKLLFTLALALLTTFGYAQFNGNVITYNFNSNPVHGVKIKTNIPFQNGTHMPTIRIEGYNYGGSETIGLSLIWYVYEGAFYHPSISSWGGYTPLVYLANENDKVVIYIADKEYFQRFKIEAFAQGMSEQPSWFQNWVIADEMLVGTQVTEVPYKNGFKGDVGIKATSYGTNGILRFIGTDGAYKYNMYLASQNKFSISDAGGVDRFSIAGEKVYMGTGSPESELRVAGNVTAKKVKVTLTGWPDYVFAKEYKLPTIQELDQYIQKHKHLPDIPSAEEVTKEGIDLGEMNKKLLQKIEELTLHIIELNKRVSAMEKK